MHSGTLEVRTRGVTDDDLGALHGDVSERLLFGVEFADGRSCTLHTGRYGGRSATSQKPAVVHGERVRATSLSSRLLMHPERRPEPLPASTAANVPATPRPGSALEVAGANGHTYSRLFRILFVSGPAYALASSIGIFACQFLTN